MAFTTPNSFTEFMDWVRTGGAEPARSNLYSVFCGMPAILRDNQIYEWRKWYEYVNFAADDVTVPSPARLRARVISKSFYLFINNIDITKKRGVNSLLPQVQVLPLQVLLLQVLLVQVE